MRAPTSMRLSVSRAVREIALHPTLWYDKKNDRAREDLMRTTRGICFLTAAVIAVSLFAALPAEAAGPFRYHAITPCRLFDTRDGTGTSAGARANGFVHTFRVQGKCGVPAGADAVSLNVTVITPSTGGHILLYPSNVPQPLVAVMTYGAQEPALANGAILPLAQVAGDDIALAIGMACGGNGCGSLHIVMDVTGFFDTL